MKDITSLRAREIVGELSDSFRALAFVGAVKAVRQEYSVYRTARGDYVVVSPSSRSHSSFHLTVVPGEKVQALRGLVRSPGVTTNSLLKDPKVVEVFGKEERTALRFEILMALYVLKALGAVELGRIGRSLTFTPMKSPT